MRNDGATDLWRLGEAAGTVGYDWAGYDDLIEQTGVGHGAAGAIIGDSNAASTFNGTATGSAASTVSAPAPNTFTVEAWFKTTSTTGGKIIGYGDTATGPSINFDRLVYLDNAGHVLLRRLPQRHLLAGHHWYVSRRRLPLRRAPHCPAPAWPSTSTARRSRRSPR